jgi:hypothetical protein
VKIFFGRKFERDSKRERAWRLLLTCKLRPTKIIFILEEANSAFCYSSSRMMSSVAVFWYTRRTGAFICHFVSYMSYRI